VAAVAVSLHQQCQCMCRSAIWLSNQNIGNFTAAPNFLHSGNGAHYHCNQPYVCRYCCAQVPSTAPTHRESLGTCQGICDTSP
jgi:hypothetical protein